MEASTGLIATSFGVLVTREVRWFTAGEVPDAVRDWFTAGGTLGFREERLDRYDRPAALRGIGLKYRGTMSLDAKHLLNATDDVELGTGIRGRVEDWVKVVKPIPEDRPRIVEQLVVVEKELLTRVYRSGDRAHDTGASGFGCEVELAALRVAGRTAWSLCLESFGDPSRRDAALANGLASFLADTPIPEGLSVTSPDSRGYPTWVAQFADAP